MADPPVFNTHLAEVRYERMRCMDGCRTGCLYMRAQMRMCMVQGVISQACGRVDTGISPHQAAPRIQKRAIAVCGAWDGSSPVVTLGTPCAAKRRAKGG